MDTYSGNRGKTKGNGRVVLMHKKVYDAGNSTGTGTDTGTGSGTGPTACAWVTDRVLALPSEIAFEDYSAITLHEDTLVGEWMGGWVGQCRGVWVSRCASVEM